MTALVVHLTSPTGREWPALLRAAIVLGGPSWGELQPVSVSLVLTEPRPSRHFRSDGTPSKRRSREPAPIDRHSDNVLAMAADVCRVLVGPAIAHAHQVAECHAVKVWDDGYSLAVTVDAWRPPVILSTTKEAP